jgi:class 3 adenylate cyclase
MRVGVNSGEAVVREVGGAGHVAYPVLGDPVNTARASRRWRHQAAS